MFSDTTSLHKIQYILPKLKLTDICLLSYSPERGGRVWRGQGVMDGSDQNNESSSGHFWCRVAPIRWNLHQGTSAKTSLPQPTSLFPYKT